MNHRLAKLQRYPTHNMKPTHLTRNLPTYICTVLALSPHTTSPQTPEPSTPIIPPSPSPSPDLISNTPPPRSPIYLHTHHYPPFLLRAPVPLSSKSGPKRKSAIRWLGNSKFLHAAEIRGSKAFLSIMCFCLALVGKCFLRLVRHPTFFRGMGPKKKKRGPRGGGSIDYAE